MIPVWLIVLSICSIGYLFGSFPAGYLAGRIVGVDVRTQGSGNIGATNVLRVLGKGWGYVVFFLDAFKGFAAVRLTFFLTQRMPSTQPYAEYFAILSAVMCVVGHTYPIWLGFKGGKGVATSAGALFGLMPLAAIIGMFIWIVTFEISRFVSVASLIAACALPAVVGLLIHWKMIEGRGLLYFSFFIAVLVVWRHRSNFSRLLKGTEQRFVRK